MIPISGGVLDSTDAKRMVEEAIKNLEAWIFWSIMCWYHKR